MSLIWSNRIGGAFCVFAGGCAAAAAIKGSPWELLFSLAFILLATPFLCRVATKSTVAIGFVLSLCTFAPADCRRVVRVQAVEHHAAVVVAPVVAAVYAPVPVYQVGYQDAGTQQLLAEVRELRQQIQQLQSGPLAQKPPATAQHPGLTFLKNSCVNCHDAQVSKAKGGGQTFFSAGELVNLTDAQRLAITTAVYSGRMPKGSKATDEDVGAVISFFDTKAAAVTMPLAK